MSISELMSRDHRHCDDLFNDAELICSRQDWHLCQSKTQAFVQTMEHHFDIEESLLFPAFESSSGMTSGPTQIMRMEHIQMRGLLQEMLHASESQDKEHFIGTAETLLIMMQQHNMKEENVLYPLLDQQAAPQQLNELRLKLQR